jgi:hypothetical protein
LPIRDISKCHCCCCCYRETFYYADDYPAESIPTATSGHEIVNPLESLGKDYIVHRSIGSAIIISLLGRFARFGRHGS